MNRGNNRIEFRAIGPFEIRRYSRFASARDLVSFAGSPALAIAVDRDDKPAGLGLAYFTNPTTVRVVALTIEESLRGLGIGRELHSRLEAELIARGATLADMLAGSPNRFLEKAGWQLGARFATVYTFSKRVGEAPWLHEPIVAPRYEVFPWLDHSEEDRRNALHLMETDPVGGRLSPFADAAQIFGPCSKGVRHASQLVGWWIVHKVESGLLRYSVIYVAPKHRGTAALWMLGGESIREHLRRSKGLPGGILAILPELPEIERFMAKRLAPWADSTESIHVWWKTVNVG